MIEVQYSRSSYKRRVVLGGAGYGGVGEYQLLPRKRRYKIILCDSIIGT